MNATRPFPIVAILVFVLTISSWWNYTAVAGGDFYFSQILLIVGHVSAVIFFQLVLIACVYFAARGRKYGRESINLVSGLCLAANFVLLVLIHFEQFAELEPAYSYTLFAAAVFAFYALTDVMLSNVLIRRGVLVAAALLLSYSVSASIIDIEIFPENSTFSGKATPVTLQKKPNIYFLGLDALAPETVAKKHLNIGHVSYAEALRNNGFRTFANAFADRAGTKVFYNSLIALDIDAFDQLPEEEQLKFFSGLRQGVLFETFRANGYRVQTLYMNNMFGDRKGKFVDSYGVSNRRDVCAHVLLFSNQFSFMGLCHERMKPVLIRINATSGLKLGGWDPDWIGFLHTRMLYAAQGEQPWVTMAHTLAPAHVKIGYNHANWEHRLEYRATFIKREKIAAKLIHEWVDFLRREDPEAILFVYGDHGSFLTAAQSYEELDTVEKRRFFVIDRHGITLAVWPKDACSDEFDRDAAKGYVTMSQVVRALIRCLSGGADPLPENNQYKLPYGNQGYEDFKYE